ncbi:preprotein translocase subunit SecA [Corynebacterium sp. sy017]|uniref:DUF5926 family protein n=1 Tax=unclassified Corynebacterium TaxID=2624378 RepID=UPI0011851475|nr:MULTISPECIES: DUF5926 family protein [unclassified Corynebacterium]MBP3089454.1 preprotein translocase subunit SecA [Corynebacterium sp. sy017]QDZ43375.1 preprotein translocase subunit SecA [Corynebacterium sp. sy039]TSD90865.1 preprotein translocase subunit SecA [Corynebacterium sp. SY003]
MAKKKKKEQLPEGMSRRQAKLAARAAQRAALERDHRPYASFPFETELVAMQEFVPAALAKVQVKGVEREVYLCTVLPGGSAALVRDEQVGGAAFVALQTQKHSHNPNRDLAFALDWVRTAQPAQTLEVGIADGTQPDIAELLVAEQEFKVEVKDDFNWWIPEGSQLQPEYAQAIQAANDSILPSRKVEAEVPGSVWWINPGDKAHIRWVRNEDEDTLLRALARIAARGELKLGAETKFAGVFRVNGLAVPVWDLDPQREPSDYRADVEALNEKIIAEIDNDAQLSADERRQLENIKSRQVTIR